MTSPPYATTRGSRRLFADAEASGLDELRQRPPTQGTFPHTGACRRPRLEQRLREVQERVVDLEWASAQSHHPGHAHRIDASGNVSELRIQTPRCDIPVLTDTQADALPAPRLRFLFGCFRELSSDSLAPVLSQHEDVLNLGNT